MKKLLEYDPLTRTTTWFEGKGNDGFNIIQSQDVEPHLKRAKALANDKSYKREGIKSDWYHFAHVPNSILLKILQEHNLDWANKYDLPKIEKILQRDYKAFLTVDKI